MIPLGDSHARGEDTNNGGKANYADFEYSMVIRISINHLQFALLALAV